MTLVMLLALVLVGFAHKLQGPPDSSDPAIEAYLASGGLLSDLCGDLDEEAPGSGVKCEACLLQAGFTLPALSKAPAFCPVLAPLDLHVSDHGVLLSHARDQSRSTRAPPIG